MSETFPELQKGVGVSVRGACVALVYALTFLSGIIYWSLGQSARGGWAVQAFFELHDPPEASLETIESGQYMRELESWLKVGAPPIVMLGAQVNTMNWVLDLEDSEGAVDRPGHWTFLASTLEELDPELGRAQRRRLLDDLGERARKLGVEVLLAVGPNKCRVYDDIAFAGEGSPPGRARFLDLLAEDCEAAGISFLDPTAELKRLREVYPSERLYLRRDTHWLPLAATHVAAMAEDLLQFEPRGSVNRPILWRRDVSGPTDLYQNWRGLDEKGFLGKRFRERLEFTWTHANDPVGVLPDKFRVSVPEAPILLGGDSFSAQGFVQGLFARLPVPIDASLVTAGSNPYENVHKALTLIESGGSNAKAIAVLGVERLFVQLPMALVGGAR